MKRSEYTGRISNLSRWSGVVVLIGMGLSLASCAERTSVPTAHEARAGKPSGWSKSQLDEFEKGYRETLVRMIPDISSDDLSVRQRGQRDFEVVCLKSAAPGSEGRRWALCVTICERLGEQDPPPARVWMVRKLEQIGGAESVSCLAKLLDDNDVQVRDAARRGLSNNPSPAATAALETALRNARPGDVEWRTGLVNALRGRGLSDKQHAYIGELTQSNDAVGIAAISLFYSTVATGAQNSGKATVKSKIDALQHETAPLRREAMAAALLRAADNLQMGSQADIANASLIYDAVLKSEVNHATVVAALRGASRTGSIQPKLYEIMQGDDTVFAAEAAAIAIDVPGDDGAKKLAERVPDLPSAIQVQLLENFADRRAHDGLKAALAVWSSPDENVRIAATRTIGILGGVAQAPRLLELAATSSGKERDAARWALSRLPGRDVDQLIAGRADDGEPAYRVEAIKAIGARNLKSALSKLVHAAGDGNEDVRIAAFNVLGDLAGDGELAALVDLLARDQGDRSMPAAEDAVVAVSNRVTEADKRATAVLAKLDAAPAPGRPALIRALGRLGGDAALAAIRKAHGGGVEAEVDAAVRALAKWPDAAVLGDLEQIAKSTLNDAHRSLALRGYFRLLKSTTDKTADQRMELVQRVVPAARTIDDRKALLGALGEIKHAEALALASSALGEEELRDEAALATVAAARRLAADQPQAARTAIERAKAATLGENARKAVDEAVEFLNKFAGYIGTWQYAGPYFQEGKEFKGVFETAFAPETPDAAGVEWKPLPFSDGANPWILDLAKIDKGANRCAYVRAWVWSEHKQDARLDTGCDDALKAWVNGESVCEKFGQRSTTPGDDKTPITLNEGWNLVMLKIVQSSGGWDFCGGVRARDGGELTGLKFKAEP